MPTEIELKLAVDADNLATIRRVLSDMAAGSPAASTLVSAYYDTPDFALSREGFSLRVRTDGGRHLQTSQGQTPGWRHPRT